MCEGNKYICKSRGKFRNLKIQPLVGDNVIFDIDKKYILEIEKRKNELIRPLVANVDQAIIVTSVKNPEFSSNLLDKLLVIIEYNNIKPVICLTKVDLLNNEELTNINEIRKYYEGIGYTVYDNTELIKITNQFKDKITVITGQTGVGKSTLLNKIMPDLQLKTNEISKALGRGKHTTRHVELIDINNSLVADTPGFSLVSFIGMKKEDIRDNFIEFNEYKHKCEYRDCNHLKESNCEIKRLSGSEILETRYQNYLKFIGGDL